MLITKDTNINSNEFSERQEWFINNKLKLNVGKIVFIRYMFLTQSLIYIKFTNY